MQNCLTIRSLGMLAAFGLAVTVAIEPAAAASIKPTPNSNPLETSGPEDLDWNKFVLFGTVKHSKMGFTDGNKLHPAVPPTVYLPQKDHVFLDLRRYPTCRLTFSRKIPGQYGKSLALEWKLPGPLQVEHVLWDKTDGRLWGLKLVSQGKGDERFVIEIRHRNKILPTKPMTHGWWLMEAKVTHASAGEVRNVAQLDFEFVGIGPNSKHPKKALQIAPGG